MSYENHPVRYTIQGLQQYTASGCSVRMDDGSWRLLRPIGYPTLWERVCMAWSVFTGKADVIIWED